MSTLNLRSGNCVKWRPPKKGRPVLKQPVPLPKLDPLPQSHHAFMMCLPRATHQVVVHLEQHTTNKFSKCDRASINRWFLTDSKLAQKARFIYSHLVAFLFQVGYNS